MCSYLVLVPFFSFSFQSFHSSFSITFAYFKPVCPSSIPAHPLNSRSSFSITFPFSFPFLFPFPFPFSFSFHFSRFSSLFLGISSSVYSFLYALLPPVVPDRAVGVGIIGSVSVGCLSVETEAYYKDAEAAAVGVILPVSMRRYISRSFTLE